MGNFTRFTFMLQRSKLGQHPQIIYKSRTMRQLLDQLEYYYFHINKRPPHCFLDNTGILETVFKSRNGS